jgi:hypothetical protein
MMERGVEAAGDSTSSPLGTPMPGIKAQHWFDLKHSLKMLVGVLAWL